ncbi:MAG: MFS transporter [Desulfobacterales bacterium]|nr:MFS transporter [Desulfobacterales bacterium]
MKSPFAVRNVRMFIAFRVFFNARFYYPIFTILFLDFGLSLNQFALLNVVWAATIVLLEVPSGALADILGRKNLLVGAGALMVVEMALLCFAPRGNPDLLFIFFLGNRILSGAAEAAASGADEALAYDALKERGQSDAWGMVLETQMRVRSLVYVFAMITGAVVYDPALMQTAVDLLGVNFTVTAAHTLRLPVFLTLVMAILTFITTCRMRETGAGGGGEDPASESPGASVVSAFRLTFRAGGWIRHTPLALVLIASGLVFDNVIRMILTLNSQYYRTIQFPEAVFGVIGSAMAVLGMIIPRLAWRLSEKRTPRFNFGVLIVLTVIGLFGMTLVIPYFGLAPVVLLVSAMYLMNFFLSHYLNQITPSHQRATVLSFKGLSFNLAYGVAGLLYSLLIALQRPEILAAHPELAGEALETASFIASIQWFPWYFLVTLGVLFIFSKRQLKNTSEYKKINLGK